MTDTPESTLLFVYGTLRRGWGGAMARRLARHGEYLGRAHCHGVLYEVAGYPALVAGRRPGDRVVGDLYRVSWPLLRRLDVHEGCARGFRRPQEYRRERLPVWCEASTKVEAWGYLFNHPVRRLRRLPAGDYLAPRRCRGRRLHLSP